jgi:transcriptional regulator with XRE-family HTH domain
MPNIAERIKGAREKRNYSQTYLAQELGISQKAYSKIETGETKLTVDNLFKIASILESTVNELLSADLFSVYNHYHTHNGEGIVINKHSSEKTIELYERLIQAKENEIAALKALYENKQ